MVSETAGKSGKWNRRKRRWVPDVVSPDYRSMVLDDTYDEPEPEEKHDEA